MTRYWVVGATVSGQDMSGDFIAKGFWFGDREDVQQTIDLISAGDRLAMKSLLGQGATQVLVKAIGLVTDIRGFAATPFKFCYVDWLDIRAEQRRVPFHNFSNTIREIDGEHPVAREVFRI